MVRELEVELGTVWTVSLPPCARRAAVGCGLPWAAAHGQAVDELLALLGGVQARCLLRCAGAKRMLAPRRVRRGLVQDRSVVDHPVRRPPDVVRLPVSLLQLRSGCIPWRAPDRPAGHCAISAKAQLLLDTQCLLDKLDTCWGYSYTQRLHDFMQSFSCECKIVIIFYDHCKSLRRLSEWRHW